MGIRDLLPIGRNRSLLPMRRGDGSPFELLRESMDRMFDRLWEDWDMDVFGRFPLAESEFSPRVDLSESDKELRVSVELPGIEEKDVEVTLSDDRLTIEGEKKEEHEEREQDRYYCECSYGRFRREIPLPAEVESDKAEAVFEKGVLTVRLPKTHAEQEKRRRIEIKTPS